MKQDAKDNAYAARQLLKLDTIRGLIKQRDQASQQILQIAQQARKDIQAVKDTLAKQLATTADKNIQKQMKQSAQDNITLLQLQAQSQVQAIRQQQQDAVNQAQQKIIEGAQPPAIPTGQQVAQAEATNIVADATAEATIETGELA